jgi:hypothetical protein
MQRPAKPCTPVQFRPQPPVFSPGGGIGRRKGLKIPRDLNPVPVRPRPRAPEKQRLVIPFWLGLLRFVQLDCR